MTYVTQNGRVLRVVISTAAKGSSLLGDAIVEATQVLEKLRADPRDVGAILLVGEGPNFCTGGDVGGFASAEDPGAHVLELAHAFHGMQRALVAAPVPVVAAVHGWAAGAGLSIALLADVAVAGASTRLRPAYPGIGFSPDGGMSWTLPRIVGSARARHILLTNAIIDAEQALALGMVAVVVDDDAVATEAATIAAGLAEGPTEAYGRIRGLVLDGQTRGLDEHLDAEAAAISASAAGAEGREGVAAFRERRTPRFHP